MSDQSKRIVFQGEDGSVKILVPPHEDDCHLTLEQIASISIPTGVRYKIVDVEEIPSDRSERMAWTVDDAVLTDGVIP